MRTTADVRHGSKAARMRDFGYRCEKCGRGKRIRTSGPCLPKTVLYQAELFPDRIAAGFPAAGQGAAYMG